MNSLAYGVFVAISLALFASHSFGWVVKTDPCPGDPSNGKLVHVIVPKCVGGPPCILKKGEFYDVEVDYVVGKHDTRNLTAVVKGIIGGIPLPWNGVGPDACADMLIGRCPLYVDDYVTYGVTLEVLQLYPQVSLIIQWELLDEYGERQWCFHLPAQIVV